MPNHIHGIIRLIDPDVVGARRHRAPTTQYHASTKHRTPIRQHPPYVGKFGKPVSGSIPTIVRSSKAAVTYHVKRDFGYQGGAVWQRNYCDHIIRDDREHRAIQRYILANPSKWHSDQDNPNQ